ncbi:MAG: dTDP-4-dehydrorhamnose reductase [Kiritimatiellia bacterium]
MKIAIAGARGMLGRDLAEATRASGREVLEYDLPEVDITCRKGGLRRLRPADCLINCAGYTDVDGAEDNPAEAMSVNRDGARNLAEWCKTRGIRLIHISTDYVFDGTSPRPYTENDPVSPLNSYGRSKLAGEQAVLEVSGANLVVRTQSLFGTGGKNFVRSITGALQERPGPVEVVDDQVSCPTWTGHLAEAILKLLKTELTGIVHVSASGSCSWYDFAVRIAAEVKPGADVRPISTDKCPRKAKRPAYSVLDKSLYTASTGHAMPEWTEGLAGYLSRQ